MQNGRIYSFGNFELDVGNRQLLRDNQRVPLPAKAFDLLHALLENNGRLVEKDELFHSVWHDQIVEESNLTVHISHIRRALGETKGNARFIETVPGYGYRFVGDVSDSNGDELVIETQTLSRITIEEEGQTERAREAETSFLPSRTFPGLLASITIATGAILVFIAAGITGFWLFNRSQESGAAAPAAPVERQPQIKRLTSKGTVNHAVLSPDGKFFAYSLGEIGGSRTSLWLGQTNGNSDVRLLPFADLGYNPRSFSADGSWLYYTVSEARAFDDGALYKMPVLGGVPQKLADGINVYTVASPDEKQIAFVRSNRENNTEALVIANLGNAGEKEIAVRPAGQSFLKFSLSWSPDGNLVAFAAATGVGKSHEIYAFNLVDGSVRQITSLEWIGVSKLDWIKDGSGLVASARDKTSPTDNQIWQIDYKSGEAKKVLPDLQNYGSTVSLSKDSNALVTVQSTQESHIWIAPVQSLARARQVSLGSAGQEGWQGVDWMPDGTIIYTHKLDQSFTIWKMDAFGGNGAQLTSAGFADTKPSVTADGKYIVFQSNRSGTIEIWRMNADGSDPRQLTFDGKNTVPHATPDGTSVVYMHNAAGKNTVRRVYIEGGEPFQITDAQCDNARVSPDGNFIACGYKADEKVKLAVVRISGGEPVKLFDVPPTYNFDGSIRWTSDGKAVAYRDWYNGVWRQDINGGEPKRLEGLPDEKLLNFVWSSDGKQFAFTRGRTVRDAVLIGGWR